MKQHLIHAMSLSLVLTSPITLGLSAIAQQSYEEQNASVQEKQTPNFWGTYRPYDAEFEAEPTALPLFALRVDEEDTTPFEVAQHSADDAFSAFFNSGYDYWDAAVLSKFWGDTVSDTKVRMGRKILWGGESKAYMQQQLLDARIKALGRAENLFFFFDAGYDYDDATALAKFWADDSPYESKLRVERNIIMGDEDLVRHSLNQARGR